MLCSCFANVVLQCLTYTRPLTAYLLNGCHGEDCKFYISVFLLILNNKILFYINKYLYNSIFILLKK